MLQLKFLRERKDATEDIPAEQPSSRQNTRISATHENPRWPPGAESQTGQGTEACRGEALLVQTLKSASDFESVYEKGAKRTSRSFVLFALANGLSHNRFGLTTPRKLGKAHDRNRIRRRVREILRTIDPLTAAGFDFVVNPRRSAGDRNFEELRSELLALLGANT
jgi:ribonuclease P protein component